jgi:neutral ceramidase
MAWQAAVGRVDITPPTFIPMGGYGAPLGGGPRTAVGTRSPLWARATVLWDSGRAHVLLCADVLGWSTGAATEVRQRVAAATGVREARLLLTATHTHNGPALPGVLDPWLTYELADTTPLEAYEEFLVDVVTGLVLDLLTGDRVPVTVDYQVTAASFSANREGLPYTETDVPVLVVRHLDGAPLAVAFGYGCHPICAGGQELWDGDYPAAAAMLIDEVLPDGLAVFLPGPAGDQDPVGQRGWPLVVDCGAQLAGAVLSAVETPGRPLTRVAASRLSTAGVPLDVTLTPDNVIAVQQAYAARRDGGGPGWFLRHAASMVDQIAAGQTLATAVELPVQGWRFAGTQPLRLAFLGGELVSGYAVFLRGRYDGPEGLWLGGYGAGSVAYLPSDELLPPLRSGGSYAGGWDPDVPGIAGGSMCIYGPPGHFLAGGVEPAIIDAVDAIVA